MCLFLDIWAIIQKIVFLEKEQYLIQLVFLLRLTIRSCPLLLLNVFVKIP